MVLHGPLSEIMREESSCDMDIMICQRQDYYNTPVYVISCHVSLWRLMANYSFVLRQRTCSCLLRLHHNPQCVRVSGIIRQESWGETVVNVGDTLDISFAAGLTFLSFFFFLWVIVVTVTVATVAVIEKKCEVWTKWIKSMMWCSFISSHWQTVAVKEEWKAWGCTVVGK